MWSFHFFCCCCCCRTEHPWLDNKRIIHFLSFSLLVKNAPQWYMYLMKNKSIYELRKTIGKAFSPLLSACFLNPKTIMYAPWGLGRWVLLLISFLIVTSMPLTEELIWVILQSLTLNIVYFLDRWRFAHWLPLPSHWPPATFPKH